MAEIDAFKHCFLDFIFIFWVKSPTPPRNLMELIPKMIPALEKIIETSTSNMAVHFSGLRQAERAIQEAHSRAMDADRWYPGGSAEDES